jgi:hypothetical protein
MIQTRFGLAKVKNDHARQAKYKLVRHWYIQRDALYARELADNLPLLVVFSYRLHRKVRIHLEAKLPIHQVLGHTIVQSPVEIMRSIWMFLPEIICSDFSS